MSLQIQISFNAPGQPDLHWPDFFSSLTSITSEQLNEIVNQCHWASVAFYTELSDRREPWLDTRLKTYYKALRENADEINKMGYNKRHRACMDDLYELLDEAARPDQRRAGEFLWLISKVIGWHYALLILCAFGKAQIQKMDEHQRIKILNYITQNRKVLYCRKLENEALDQKLENIRTFLHSRIQ